MYVIVDAFYELVFRRSDYQPYFPTLAAAEAQIKEELLIEEDVDRKDYKIFKQVPSMVRPRKRLKESKK